VAEKFDQSKVITAKTTCYTCRHSHLTPDLYGTCDLGPVDEWGYPYLVSAYNVCPLHDPREIKPVPPPEAPGNEG
jgi:hypothetical protein